jgi:O-antigen/teichoic acid export membrane protein
MSELRGTGQALGWRTTQLALSQIISLLRLIVLARIVAPDAFGLVAVAAVVLSLFMGVSNFGMVQALVQHPNPGDAEYDAAWTLRVLRAAAVTVALVVAGPLLAGLYGAPEAAGVIRLLALRPLIDALGSIGVARLTRTLGFRGLALMTIAGTLADAVTAISLAPALGVWALVIGTLTGATVQSVLSYVVAPHRPRFRVEGRAATPLMAYGRWVLLTSIVALAGTALVHLWISRSLGPAALGTYFVASRLAFMPGEVAAAVIGAVAFPLFAAQRADLDRSASTFSALFSGQVILLFPLCAIIVALAPELESALGPRWTGAAPTAQVLAVACMIGVFGDSVTPLLHGRGRADRVLVIEIVQTGTQVLLLWPLIGAYGVAGAAVAWLGGNAASQVACAAFARDVLPRALGPQALRRLATGTIAAAAAAAAAGAVRLLADGFAALIAGGVAGVIAAALTLAFFNSVLELKLPELLPWHPSWGPRTPTLVSGEDAANVVRQT